MNNLNFVHGTPGDAPPGWFLGPEWYSARPPANEAMTVSGASCSGGQRCATVQSVRDAPASPVSFLYQIVDATQYRGKRMIFRADVRTGAAGGSVARLLVRVHRPDCSTAFFYDMGKNPITSSTWSSYQIDAAIAPDARDIEFGMQLIGKGAAWIDNIKITFVDAFNSR